MPYPPQGFPPGLTLTECMSVFHKAVGDAAWEDWDISALVPEGTEYAVVLIRNSDVAAIRTCGARRNGSADERRITLVALGAYTLITEVDSNRIIEIYAQVAADVNFHIVGYGYGKLGPVAGGGATTFLGLTDTPGSYAGQATKYPRVKADESALEFVAGAGGAATFLELSDTPAAYAGQAGKIAKVNAAANALEFALTPKNTAMAYAWMSGDLATQNNVEITVQLNTEVYDPGGNFDIVNYRYKAPVAGYYGIIGGLSWDWSGMVANKPFYSKIVVNAAIVDSDVKHSASVDRLANRCVSLQHLDVDDLVYLKALQISGGNTPILSGDDQGMCFLQVFLIQAD